MQTRTLKDPAVKAARLARIHELHVAPLTAFVERIRRTDDPYQPYWAPYFDPKSGGVGAQVLLLLESPGPQVSRTEFVSADNPDGTAENMSCLLKLASLSRQNILLWNIFPWQLSAESVIAPGNAHLMEAAPTTRELLTLLPALKVIVLIGNRAKAGWEHVGVTVDAEIKVLHCPHPSPIPFSVNPESAVKALSVLVQAQQLCS
ncbi:uracil-DNA glycosylase [Deinococcus altitudinis]|uniref:uracil-DNA glycosylase n=1 Tax=Deinococcus altitudinis TaxID=468914 RepID=UPI0038928ED9